MKLNYKETNLNISYVKTESNLGLDENDYWLMTDLNIQNNEFKYANQKEMTSTFEVINLLAEIKKFLKDKNQLKEKIVFIKNYFDYSFSRNKKNEVKMVMKLKGLKSLGYDIANYNIEFNEEEIIEYVDLQEKCL